MLFLDSEEPGVEVCSMANQILERILPFTKSPDSVNVINKRAAMGIGVQTPFALIMSD
jgi:hypothetical protein